MSKIVFGSVYQIQKKNNSKKDEFENINHKIADTTAQWLLKNSKYHPEGFLAQNSDEIIFSDILPFGQIEIFDYDYGEGNKVFLFTGVEAQKAHKYHSEYSQNIESIQKMGPLLGRAEIPQSIEFAKDGFLNRITKLINKSIKKENFIELEVEVNEKNNQPIFWIA